MYINLLFYKKTHAIMELLTRNVLRLVLFIIGELVVQIIN